MKKHTQKIPLIRRQTVYECILVLFFSFGMQAFGAFTAHSEPHEQEKTQFVFSTIDMVRLGPEPPELYEIYTIGDGSQSVTAKRWLTPFEINRYETTYELWYDTRIIAEELGYIFINPGQEGSDGKRGGRPTKEKYQPVTRICWYDAIIWCNALSEIHGLTPCYTYKGSVLKDATDTVSCDLCVCDWNADGYRLPTETEWEFAARRTPTGFQSGSLVSGQVDANGNEDASIPEEELSWSALNAYGTHRVGTAGSPFTEDAPPESGSGNPNAAGIFDMSGNVSEFVWDWNALYTETKPETRSTGAEAGNERICRGGSWSPYTPFIYAGDRYSYDPNECYNYLGFRFCRTVQ